MRHERTEPAIGALPHWGVAAVWVTGPAWPRALVFIQVDGESVAGERGLASRVMVSPGRERDPYRDEGGEG